MIHISRRLLVIASAATMVATTSIEAKFPSPSRAQDQFDFSKPLEGWDTISGRWTTEDVADAAWSGRVLVQSTSDNAFNVIVAPGGPYEGVSVSVRDC
jgi:hypothetical protein